MTDQAVDAAHSAGRPGAGCAPGRVPRPHRELKALRADIERAGLHTLSGRSPPRRVLLIAGRPGSGRTALAEEFVRQARRPLPRRCAAGPAHRARRRPVPIERTARDLLAALGVGRPRPAPPRTNSPRRCATPSPGAGRCCSWTTPPTPSRSTLLPDSPGLPGRRVSAGPLTGVPDVRPCTLGGLDSAAAVELLGRYAGPVRITVDPRTAEALAEECGGQPAALVLAGGWLAARPKASRSPTCAKQLRDRAAPTDLPTGARPLARAFRLVYDALPRPPPRMLRLLALAPAGLVDAHTASALAGCSVAAAATTLDDFAALGLLRPVAADDGLRRGRRRPWPQYAVPGCLDPLLRANCAEDTSARPSVQLARARMLERTVRLLQACRAITEPAEFARPAEARRAAARAALPAPGAAAATGCAAGAPALLAAARLAVADGELDTLARRLISALARALDAHQRPRGGRARAVPAARAGARGRRAARAAAGAGRRAAQPRRPGRAGRAAPQRRSPATAARWTRPARRRTRYATGRALESLGGTYPELGDWQRAADWYGRALALRLTRDERRRRGPAARPDRRRAHLRGPLGRGAARLAGGGGGVPQAGRCGRPTRGRWRGGPGAGVRGPARGGAAHLPGGPGVRAGAGDGRLQAALQLRLADTLERLGDPRRPRLHRARRGERAAGEDRRGQDADACEIRSAFCKRLMLCKAGQREILQ